MTSHSIDLPFCSKFPFSGNTVTIMWKFGTFESNWGTIQIRNWNELNGSLNIDCWMYFFGNNIFDSILQLDKVQAFFFCRGVENLDHNRQAEFQIFGIFHRSSVPVPLFTNPYSHENWVPTTLCRSNRLYSVILNVINSLFCSVNDPKTDLWPRKPHPTKMCTTLLLFYICGRWKIRQ